MTTGERLFTGWMDPRGIVAAATASTFSAGLVVRHVGGASKILPVTFLVIVVTVAVYGLTAVPVAGWLGVTRPARARPLLVGGHDWVIDLGRHRYELSRRYADGARDLRAARRRYGQRRR